MTARLLERDLVVLACAVSAGIHGALVHEHLAEGIGPGGGFLVSSVLLVGLATALTYRPRAGVLAAASALFAGLLVSYLLAVTTGVPLLHPEREAVDGLALLTKAVEAGGLLGSLHLLASGRAGRARTPAPAFLRPKGTST